MSSSPPTPSLRHRFAPRVGVVLLLLAAVPLLGFFAVGRDLITEAERSSERAASAGMLSGDVVSLVALQAALTDEMNSTLIIEALTDFGVPASLVRDAIGLDLEAIRAASADEADSALAELDMAPFVTGLASARDRAAGVEPKQNAYRSLIDDVEVMRDDAFGELVVGSTALDGGELLVESVRALDAVASVRQAAAEQFFGVFTAEFGLVGDDGTQMGELIRQRNLQDAAEDAIRRLVRPDSDFARELRAVEQNPQVVAFDVITDDRVAEVLLDGAPSDPVTLLDLQARADELRAIYTTSVATSAAYGDLVTLAGSDVSDAAASLQSTNDERAAKTITLLAILSIGSLVAAAFATIVIVRPLNALRRSAEQMRDGDARARLRPRGPIEVRAASHALNDAADHLELATLQARTLGSGDMDSDVFERDSAGGLGEGLQAAVATLRSSMAKQSEFQRLLAHEAAHDGLTHLPNRRASMAQLTRSLARTDRSDSSIAVMFVDLDGFKGINDQHGHPVGDAVLVEVAKRILALVRTGDHVGRLGGDEFLVIAEPVVGVDDSIEIAERIITSLSEPFDVGSTRVSIGASVGIALANDSRLTADELIRDADLAVYKAKASGRGAVELCDDELRKQLVDAADLQVAIAEAIRDDQFELHFQPIVNRTDQALHSLEGLIRWRKPGEDHLVAPDGFIPFAEQSSLIIDIDRWVLDAATRQIAEWSDDPLIGGVPVAVNISGRHLDTDTFVSDVLEAIERHGIAPGLLTIEVTESAIVVDLVAAGVKLQRLRDYGVTIAIDDFGTGYTSLAHLRALPVDVLKIDRSFVSGASTSDYEESIVRLIIDTGHLLGATVTAEGIETDDEAHQLTSLGSDNMQGYYFARPCQATELHEVLDRLGATGVARHRSGSPVRANDSSS